MTIDNSLKRKLELKIKNELYDESSYTREVHRINPFKGVRFSLSETSRRDLDDSINKPVDTFVTTLLRLIDESGMTDVEVYTKARIGRKLFSKIRGDIEYTPSKKTIFCFILALKLSLEDSKMLLKKAGYTFSSVSKTDIIIKFFVEHGEYDIDEINEILFEHKQPLLGQ